MRNDMKLARGRRSLLVRFTIGMLLISWLAMAATLNKASATTTSPQFGGCRTVSSLSPAPAILSRVTWTPVPFQPDAIVRLVLNTNHRMFCAFEIRCAPGVFTLDTVKYRLSLSTNINSITRNSPDPSNPSCALQDDYIPQNQSQGSVLYVKIYFQENYNVNGGVANPKKKACTIPLPARGFPPVAEGEEFDLLAGGYQITEVNDTEPDGH